MAAAADCAPLGVVGSGSPWVSLFGIALDSRLDYYETEFIDGVLRILRLVIEEVSKLRANSLVGQFLWHPASISSIRFLANWLWGRDGEVRISKLGDNMPVGF
ncbi:unnamed protein product [Linum trigynum]|uniref:Uncharacterized protein n=1 Tax=Linum trigynum TaxID=586398 RepID=A0AAV2GNG0_9ROSI